MGDRVTRADPPSIDEMGLLDIAAAVAAVITASGRIAAATYRTRSLAKGGGGREGHLPPPTSGTAGDGAQNSLTRNIATLPLSQR